MENGNGIDSWIAAQSTDTCAALVRIYGSRCAPCVSVLSISVVGHFSTDVRPAGLATDIERI